MTKRKKSTYISGALVGVLVLGLTSCRSKKETVAHASERDSVRTTIVEQKTDSATRSRWENIALWADSLDVTFEADSIVTPDGAVSHRPRLRLSIKSPAIEGSMEEAATSGHESLTTADLTATRQSLSSESKSTQHNPPVNMAVIILLAGAMITAAYIMKHRNL